MWFLWFLGGVLLGAAGAVIYYRRHVAKIEAALAEAVALRKRLEENLAQYAGKK